MTHTTPPRSGLPAEHLNVLVLGNRKFVTATSVAEALGISLHEANVRIGDLVGWEYMRRSRIDGRPSTYRATRAGEEIAA